MPQISPNTIVADQYKVLGLLGVGSMGRVYEAEQVSLGRKVALKVLDISNTNATQEEQRVFQERFFQEARLCGQLSHPNIVTVYDSGELEIEGERHYFMTMELLFGETLEARISQGPRGIEPSLAVRVAVATARGLRAAHELGIVHRDLKPANIMLVPGEDDSVAVKIVDFGLVLDTRKRARVQLTQAGTVVGSPAYMSPEQVEGRPLDGRSDLYSLGVVLFECLTGDVPFDGSNIYNVMRNHMNTVPPPVSEANPKSNASLPLERLVGRLLSKAPDSRYATIDNLLRDLRRLPESRSPYGPSKPDIAKLPLAVEKRYEIKRVLSAGSHSTLYEGIDERLRRTVVIKLFQARHQAEGQQIEYALSAHAALRHSNNALLLDVGVTQQDGQAAAFLVSERAKGRTLADRLRAQGQLKPFLARKLVAEVAWALSDAHDSGLVHGDLEPDHIILTQEEASFLRIKVVGYRLQLPTLQGEHPPSSRGTTATELRFLAPELRRGARPTERSDIYALGRILEECVANQSLGAELQATSSASPSAAGLQAYLSAARQVIAACTHDDPAERPANGRAFLALLQETWPKAKTPSISPAPPSVRPIESPSSPPKASRGRASSPRSGKVRRATAGKNGVEAWVLGGANTLRHASLQAALIQLREKLRLVEIAPEDFSQVQAELLAGTRNPPWVAIWADADAVLEHPIFHALMEWDGIGHVHVSADDSSALSQLCDEAIQLPATASQIFQRVARLIRRSHAKRLQNRRSGLTSRANEGGGRGR